MKDPRAQELVKMAADLIAHFPSYAVAPRLQQRIIEQAYQAASELESATQAMKEAAQAAERSAQDMVRRIDEAGSAAGLWPPYQGLEAAHARFVAAQAGFRAAENMLKVALSDFAE